MNAKVKYSTFIDSVHIELNHCTEDAVKAVLRDEHGSICRQMETEILEAPARLTWKGLDNLPYGVYTLELYQGKEEVRVRMVKRV
jgi:hypothetical protein